MSEEDDNGAKLINFLAFTGSDNVEASTRFLESSAWDVPTAVQRWFEFGGDPSRLAPPRGENHATADKDKSDSKEEKDDDGPPKLEEMRAAVILENWSRTICECPPELRAMVLKFGRRLMRETLLSFSYGCFGPLCSDLHVLTCAHKVAPFRGLPPSHGSLFPRKD